MWWSSINVVYNILQSQKKKNIPSMGPRSASMLGKRPSDYVKAFAHLLKKVRIQDGSTRSGCQNRQHTTKEQRLHTPKYRRGLQQGGNSGHLKRYPTRWALVSAMCWMCTLPETVKLWSINDHHKSKSSYSLMITHAGKSYIAYPTPEARLRGAIWVIMIG